MTNLTLVNGIVIATGAATVTSNVASYFDEYQSMFTVGISFVTCIGFIASIGWNMWLKWDERKYKRRKDEEGKD